VAGAADGGGELGQAGAGDLGAAAGGQLIEGRTHGRDDKHSRQPSAAPAPLEGPNRQVHVVRPVGKRNRMADRDETPDERYDRNWAELLQELRVAQTGVQILFAFLLTLPFNTRFEHITTVQRATYIATLLLTALASLCLIAPVSQHRILFRRGRKEELVAMSSNLAGIGLWFLWLSIVGAVFLIFEVVVGTSWAIGVGAAFAAAFVGIWYVLPTLKR
jgi:hypothetical protein